MTKHEADVIGGLNMTDQISNEAYKQIMIAAQDENEVGEVLDNVRAEMDGLLNNEDSKMYAHGVMDCLEIIDKFMAEGGDKE